MKLLSILSLGIILSSCGSSSVQSNNKVRTISTPPQEIDYWNNYKLIDKKYGTHTIVTLEFGQRIMKTNAIPNHETGIFPNPGNPNSISEQKITYKFPLEPKFSGEAKWAREPGIALNGVKFEPETAERFVCETGEIYKIEAFQDIVDLGLDDNHAHVQPTGAYHYHGVPTGLIKILDKGEDLILVGFAKDGFPMYYSKSGKYKPSFKLSEDLRKGDVCTYKNPKEKIQENLNETTPDGTFVSDWIYEEGLGQLDECNGTTLDGKYVYFVTDEYPYVGRCLKGEFTEHHPPGPPPGGHHHGPPPPHHHH